MVETFKSLADEKLKSFNYEYDQYFVDEFVKKLTDQDIQILVTEVQNMQVTEEEFTRVRAIIDKTKDDNDQRIKDQQNQVKATEEKKKAKRAWTKDEFIKLAKALNKYPGGTQERWKTIAEFMGEEYHAKDMIDMAKTLTEKRAMRSGGKNVVGDAEKIHKSKGGRKEEAEEKKEENRVIAGEEWTEDQQKLLELALKKFPKNLSPKARWGGIAKAVGDKTPKDCLARFKYVSALLKKKPSK
jgi:DnaJ family protein C protein 2